MSDDFDFGDADPQANWPEPTSIQQLHDYIEALPFDFNLSGGAYVAGGAIVRAHLGLPFNDIDVWVPTDKLHGEAEQALERAGWVRSKNPGSMGSRQWARKGWIPLDLIGGGSPAETLANFDWRCSKVAMDDAGVFLHPGARLDITDRRLICTRRVTHKRLWKYQTMGFNLPEGVLREDVLLPETATFEQCFGRKGVPLGPTAAERML